MLLPSLRIALRRMGRRPGTTGLHVVGLAVGLACCFLALLFVRDELSVDRFHDGADRIVQVQMAAQFGDQTLNFLSLPAGGLEAIQTDVPGVEAVTQTHRQTGLVRTSRSAEGVALEQVRFADSAFFDVFNFSIQAGDADTPLGEPGSVVLASSVARTLFGDASPVGEAITLERTGFGIQDAQPIELTVTAVAHDPPATTSLDFDLVISGQTQIAYYEEASEAIDPTAPTYIRLASLRDTVGLQAALMPLAEAEPMDISAIETPRLVDAYLGPPGSPLEGRRLFMALFVGVAGLVLLLACVNYANLATALATQRASEVGVRKTLGAARGQLARLFLSESVLLAVAAGVLAVGIAWMTQDAFNTFFGKSVALSDLGVVDWAVALVLCVLTGVVAGMYPAGVLASLRPISALGGHRVAGKGGTRVRQTLVVLQFSITAVLLTATAIVADQLQAARAQELGFAGDRVFTLDLGSERLRASRDVIKAAIGEVPGVAHVSLASGVPGDINSGSTVTPVETPDDRSDDISVSIVDADADYLATTGLALTAGAWFEPETSRSTVVLNETAARLLGLMTTEAQAAVGQTVMRMRGEAVPATVVGVVKDFHFTDLRSEIKPLIIEPLGERFNTIGLAVQLGAADAGALEAVEAAWSRVSPEYAFDPVFVDDHFASQMREDRQLAQLFGAFGLVAIVLACVGVFGLAAHAAERRTKEIGIRKVLGASVAGLIARLSGEFARLVVVALAIAVPITILLAQRWLEDFAYPVALRPGPFVAVGLGVLTLALLTSGVHALRAALADPVRALRSD